MKGNCWIIPLNPLFNIYPLVKAKNKKIYLHSSMIGGELKLISIVETPRSAGGMPNVYDYPVLRNSILFSLNLCFFDYLSLSNFLNTECLQCENIAKYYC